MELLFLCSHRYFAFAVIKSWGACICTNGIPSNDAKLDNSKCDSKSNNAVAVFYNDKSK